MNVAAIKLKAESGDLPGAHAALDALLELGPSNLEALKLRARLHQVTGRFLQEAQMWEKVAQIAKTDDDLIDYLVRRQSEDRENFYFTDALPNGGKRFLAFPKKMLMAATLGLLGCLAFFTVARVSQVVPFLGHPVAMLASFFLLVVAPFVSIIWCYARSLKHIAMSLEGLEVATRIRTHRFPRAGVDKVFVVHDDRDDAWQLRIIITSKPQASKTLADYIEVDFDEGTTPIQARSYFIRELTRFFGEPSYVSRIEIQERLRGLRALKV
jgi:hypothetical protein